MNSITTKRGSAIGEVARATGANIETIRYYERIGLMPKPDRTLGGNRIYAPESVRRLLFIRRCRELGFAIPDIRELLAMADRNDFTCGDIHRMTVAHLAGIERKIADLAALQKTLSDMAAKCGLGDKPECPILETLRTRERGAAEALPC